MILAIVFSLYMASAIARAPAEQPITLSRHSTTMPAQIKAVETVQRVYLSDGTVRESSLGVVTLDANDKLTR